MFIDVHVKTATVAPAETVLYVASGRSSKAKSYYGTYSSFYELHLVLLPCSPLDHVFDQGIIVVACHDGADRIDGVLV